MIRELYYFLRESIGKREKLFLIYGVCCVTFYVLYAGSLPYLFKLWIDESLIPGNLEFFWKFGIFLGILTLIAIIIDWVGSCFLIKARESSRAEIRIRLLDKLQKIPVNEVEKKGSGYFTEMLLSDVDFATGMIVSLVYIIVPAVIGLPLSVYWSFKLSGYFAVIGMVGFVLIFANVYYFSFLLRSMSTLRQDFYSKASGVIQESVMANFLIRLSQIEVQIAQRNRGIFNLLRDASINKHVTDYTAASVQNFVTQFLQVVAVFVAIYVIVKLKVDLTATAIMTGIFYLIKIWSPINLLSSLNAELQEAIASVKRISDIIESRIEPETGTKKLSGEIEHISCKKLNINIDSKNLISNLDLQIKQGEKIGIQGKSGCGKTTLLKTLLGFHSNWSGLIQLNDISLKELSRSTVLNKIAYMPQEVFVFRENLFFNIALNYQYDEPMMKSIVQRFHLVGLLSQTNKTALVPSNISGGEKKRIGLARLFYANKEILIFDEPFSGLDVNVREDIYKEIFTEFKDKTIIIVSHNNRDLQECDFKVNLTNEAEIIKPI